MDVNTAFLICAAWMLPMCSAPPSYFSITPPYYAPVEQHAPAHQTFIVPYGPAATMSMRSRHDIAIHSIRNTR